MVMSKYLNALIHELERLYKQLTLAQLHKRMHSYHGRRSNHPHAADINLTLSEYIESIIPNHDAVPPSPQTSQPERTFTDTRDSHVTDTKKPDRSYPYKTETDHHLPESGRVDKNKISELSKYFKRRTNDAELHPTIKEKLKRSVSEHINAAIQCALRGDRRNAKMHVDIASYAFREIAHYMPEDQYRTLTATLDEHLSALTADDQHAHQPAVNTL